MTWRNREERIIQATEVKLSDGLRWILEVTGMHFDLLDEKLTTRSDATYPSLHSKFWDLQFDDPNVSSVFWVPQGCWVSLLLHILQIFITYFLLNVTIIISISLLSSRCLDIIHMSCHMFFSYFNCLPPLPRK